MNGRNGSQIWTRRVARILRVALEQGASVEIDGLGTFLPGKQGARFVAQDTPRVFLAYVEEDLRLVKRLYQAFEESGFRPWLDKKKLMPGQNWPRAIENAIQVSDFFVACFSRRATSKRGSFHSELRFALNCAAKVPLDEIFLVPVRLDECVVPRRIARQVQYVDLFPRWDEGVNRVMAVMREQRDRRKRKLPLAG
ncbi:MAG TPA: toll/interleukin-1 receptor domain-containing protein [Bryobacteraceae bacterium]|nr:toll/interleukin-1 receptor domain-containing protein [Bryobacteraceae bacterium]